MNCLKRLLTLAIFFLSFSSIALAQSRLIAEDAPNNVYSITFTDVTQTRIVVHFDDFITSAGTTAGWTITVSGSPIALASNPSRSGTDLTLTLVSAIDFADREDVLVSYDPAIGTVALLSGLEPDFTIEPATNNYIATADDFTNGLYGENPPKDICAAVEDVEVEYNLFLSQRYRNSIHYDNPRAWIMWDFPDGGDRTLTGFAEVTIGSGIYNITAIFASYPDNTINCNWVISYFPYLWNTGTLQPNLLVTQNRVFITIPNYKKDNGTPADATGSLSIDPPLDHIHTLFCLGEDIVDFTFSEEIEFDCRFEVETELPNINRRWVNYVYGSHSDTDPGLNGIPNVFIDVYGTSVQVTDANGDGIIQMWHVNPDGSANAGGYFTNSGYFEGPVTEYNFNTEDPYELLTSRIETYPISHTGDYINDAVDDVFEVMLNAWGPCNSYTLGEDPVTIYSRLRIVDAPPPPTVPDKIICFGGDPELSVTSAPVGGIFTWYANSDKTGELTTGEDYDPGVTISDIYNYYVTDRQTSGDLCEGPATEVELLIKDELDLSGSISGPTDVCQSETGIAFSVPAPTYTAASPNMTNGGATEIWWNVPAGWTITSGQGTRNMVTSANATVAENLTVTAEWRYTDNTCGSSLSFDVDVNQTPSGTNQTFTRCENIQLNLDPQDYTNVASSTFDWSGNNGSSGTGDIDDAPTNPGTTQIDIIYTITPTGPTGCVGNDFTITVHLDPETLAGTLAYGAGEDQICLGDDINLAVTGYVGDVERYRWYLDGSWEGNTISSSDTRVATPDEFGTWEYQVRIQSGTCPYEWSNTTSTIVDPTTDGGSVTPNRTVCQGSNSGLLSLGGEVGNIDDWEYRYRPTAGVFGGWTSIGNTAQTYTSGALSDGTYEFRAVVTSGECLTENSDIATITVDQASVGGTLTGANDICNGGNPTTLSLTGGSYTGTVLRWDVNIDGGGWNVVGGATAASYNPPATTTPGDHVYRVAVVSGVCAEDLSTTQTIVVNNALSLSASGSETSGVVDDLILCLGEDVDFSTAIINPGTGSGYSYAWSGDNGQTAVGASPTITPNSTGTIRYTVTLTDDFSPTAGGSCEASDFVDVIVLALPTVGIAPAGPTGVCLNTDQSLNGNAVAGTRAITSYTWTGDTDPLDATNVDDVVFNSSDPGAFNLTYTVIDNYGCIASDNTTINVTGPVVNIAAATAGVCEDNNLAITAVEDLANSGGGESRAWTGLYEAVPLTGGELTALLSTTNNPNTTFNTNGDAGLSTGTYTMIYTVTDGGGCSDGDTIIVEVSTVTATITSDASVCAGIGLVLDGQPSGGTGVYPVNTWTRVNPAAGWTLTANGDPTTATMTVPAVVGSAVYTLSYYVEDQNGCSFTTPNYNVNVFEVPVADAGSEDYICIDISGAVDYTMAATASVGTGTWTVVSEPAGSSLSFNAVNSATTTINVDRYGDYILRWTEVNGAICSSQDEVNLHFAEVAAAGADQGICEVLSFTLAGNAPTIGTGTWTRQSGPGTVSFTNGNLNTTTASATAYGSYVLRWTIDNGGGCSTFEDMTIAFTETANAGTDVGVCSNLNSLNLAGNTPSHGSGLWTVNSSPGGSIINFGDNTSPTSSFTVDTYGEYTLQWTLNNPTGATCSSNDEVVVAYTEQAAAGADQGFCSALTVATLAGNTPSHGSGLWTVINSPGGSNVTFSNNTLATSTATVDMYGEYTLRWTLSNPTGATCSSTDDVIIAYTEDAAAGPDQGFCSALTVATLAGNTPSHGSGLWTVINSPGGSNVTFSNNTLATSTATVDMYGEYTLRWTLSNPTGATCSSDDDVVIAYTEDATAGPDQGFCSALTVATLAGNTPSHGSGLWTVINSPGGSNVTFSNNTLATSTATVDTYGEYTLRWTLSNPTGATCSSNEDVIITYTEAADAGSDQGICAALNTSLDGNTPSHGSGLWTVVNQPGGSTVTLGNNTMGTSTISVDLYGEYTLRWTLSNPTGATCSSQSDVVIGFTEQVTVGPDQEFCAALTVATLAGNTPSHGSGLWTVVSSPGGSNVTFSNNTSGTSTATVDMYGEYTLRWTLTNPTGGGCTTDADVILGYTEQATAGPDQGFCSALTVATLAGNTPSHGSGLWTVISSPGGSNVLFSNSALATSTATVDTYGEYTLRWTLTNPTGGVCTTDDDVVIAYTEDADAGSDQGFCSALTVATLAGNTPSHGSGLWTVIGSPGGSNVTFSNNTLATSTATVDMYGEYTLRWTLSNPTGGTCSSDDDVVIAYTEDAAAGPNQLFCGALTVATLAGNTPSHGSGLWTVINSPGGSSVNFANSVSATSTATVDTHGEYTLRWTLSNPTGATCSSNDDLIISYTEQAAAGLDQDICGTLATVLAGNTPSHGTGLWTVFASPGGSTVTFIDDTNPLTNISVDQYGSYTLEWTLTNPTGVTCSTSDEVILNFAEQANAGPNQYLCEILSIDLDANTPSVGSGLWTVSSTDGAVTSWGAGATNPDITVIVNNPGRYTFRWTITNGGCSTLDENIVDLQPSAAAGLDQDVACNLLTTTLVGNDPVVGRGIWTLTGANPGTISSWNGGTSAADFNAQPVVSAYGSYTFRWTLENGNFPAVDCSSLDDVVITFYEQHTAATVIDFDVCRDSSLAIINLSGTFGGGASSAAWSILSGNGSLQNEATAANTVSVEYLPLYTDIDNGSIQLRLMTNIPAVDETCPREFNDIIVGIDEAVYVVIHESPSIFIAAGSSGNLTATISGASGAITTGTWTEIGPNTGGTFAPNNTTTNITFTPTAAQELAGGLTLRLTSDDPGTTCGPTFEEIYVGIGENPVADALADETICEPLTMQITLEGQISGSATSGTWTLGGAGTFELPVIGAEDDNGTPADTTDDYRPVTQIYNVDAGDLALPNNTAILTFRLTTNDPDGAGPVMVDWDEKDISIISRPNTPPIAGGGLTSMCIGTSGQYYEVTNVVGNTYTWTVPAGVTISNGGTTNWIVLSYPNAGDYTIEVQEFTPVPYACADDAQTLDIHVYSVPVAYAGDDAVVCDGEAVVLGGEAVSTGASATGGSGTYTYSWNPSFSLDDALIEHPTATPSNTRTYTLTVTDAVSGCAPANDAVTVTVNTISGGTLAGDQTVCDGTDPAIITSSVDPVGAGAVSYDWEESNDLLAWTSLGVDALTYDPGVPSETMFYKRIAFSDMAGKICSNESNVIEITYNSAIAGAIGSDAIICSGDDPLLLTSLDDGSVAGAISYQWQSSVDDVTFFTIGGANFSTYDPPAQAVTTYFRRQILSTLNFVTCEDFTTSVEITVNNSTSGTITNDQTICSAGDPAVIGSSDDGTASGVSSWIWESSVDGFTFNPIAGEITPTYDPPAGLIQTTYYHRIHTSTLTGVDCEATSNIITVTVNDVSAGSVSADQTICSGDDPVAFSNVVLGTGSGAITYSWESSPDNAAWTATGGTAATYDHGVLAATTYFRRVATSTLNAVGCDAISNVLTVTVNDVDAGTIDGTQTVCDGDDPGVLGSTLAGTGSGVIAYQWQSSLDNLTYANIIGATTDTYDPGVLASTTYYKRITTSTLNFKECSAETAAVTVFLNNPDPGSINSDQTICNGDDPAAFTSVVLGTGPGAITYRWESRTGVNAFAAIAASDSPIYDHGVLIETTDFRRVTISTYNAVACEVISNELTVTVNDVTSGAIGTAQTICSATSPALLTDETTATGSGVITYIWESSTDGVAYSTVAGATAATFTPPALTLTTWYRRVATSSLNAQNCSATTADVIITINDVTEGTITNDQTICSAGDPAVIGSSDDGTASGVSSWVWESSVDGFTYAPIAGEITPTYDPPAGLVQTTYYHRIHTSTLSGVACEATSNVITITVNDVSAGSVSADQTICFGGDPVTFSNVVLGTGSGAITYSWESSPDNAAWTATGGTAATYDHGALNSDTYFHRVATSTLNAVACVAESNSLLITVNDVDAGTIDGTQTVCDGDDPGILGSTLAGTGSGVITYQWQSSIDNLSYVNILGASADTYDPGVLTSTTYYKRITTSTLNARECSAETAELTVFLNNPDPGSINSDQTICNGDDPAAFTSVVLGTGPGAITYRWESRTGVNAFAAIAASDSPIYDHGVLIETTDFRRVTISTYNAVACEVISNELTVTVNDVTSGAIGTAQTICSATSPALLTDETTATGSGVITYIWESSTDGVAYSTVAGATAATFTPPALTLTTWYRRVATSSLNAQNCSATTADVIITINDVTEGTITNDQTICSAGDPAVIGSSDDGTGSGVSNWVWESSVDGFTYAPIAGEITPTYDPPAGLVQTTYYHRIHTSTLNGVDCEATSNVITVTVNDVSAGSVSADQTICNGDDPMPFNTVILGSGSGAITYSWESSPDDAAWTATGGTAANYDHGILAINTYFHRVATSTLNGVGCTAESNSLLITVNDVDGGVIDGTQTVCELDDPVVLTSTTDGTGDGAITYQWYSSTDNVGFVNILGANAVTFDPPVVTITTYYKRITTSTLNAKACTDESNTLTVFLNNTDPGTLSGNQTICNGDDPVVFTSLLAGTGPGAITYRWESRTGVNAFAAIAASDVEAYNPDPLFVTTDFRRVTISTYNGVPCEAISNELTITINDLTSGAIGTSETICYGTSPASLTDDISATGSGVLTYIWENSTDGITYNTIAGATMAVYSPPALTQTTWYRRIVSSTLNANTCSATTGDVIITVNPLPVGVLSGDATICAGSTTPLTITISTGLAPYDVTIDNGIGTLNFLASPGVTNVGPIVNTTYNLVSIEDANGCISNFASGNLSGTATIIARDTVEIITQPVDSEVCEATNTQFALVATGDGLTYQWEYTDDLANAFVDVDGTLLGHTNFDQATMDIANVDPIYDGYYYRAFVNGTCPEFAYSDTVQLIIQYDPITASDPLDQLVCEGDAAGFGVDAGITENPIFQWSLSTDGGGTWDDLADTAVYAGSNTDSLIVASTATRFNNYQYKVTITGDCGGFNESLPATLLIDERPEIVDQPDELTVCEDNPAQFIVDAGVTTNATYQWQVNMNGGAGFENIAEDSAGVYNGFDEATLDVLNASSRFNNYDYRVIVSGDCPSSVTSISARLTVQEEPEIITQPVDSTICEGESPFFSVNAGVTSNVQYNWQVSTDGGTSWGTLEDTAIYNGSNTPILRLLSVPSSYDGMVYQAVISGSCPVPVESDDALLTVRERPEILEHPDDTTVCETEPVAFSVNAGLTDGVIYQWQVDQGMGFNTIGIDTALVYDGFDEATLNVLNPTSRFDGYRYRVLVSGLCTPAQTSTSATLYIYEKAEIINEPVAKEICETNNTFFTVNTGVTSGPTYTWQVDMGSGFVEIGADSAVYGGSGTSTLLLSNVPSTYNGYTYRVVVGGICPETQNSAEVGLIVNDEPEIIIQPVNDTVCENSPANFSVNAGVTTGVQYTWYVNSSGFWQEITLADQTSGEYGGVKTANLTVVSATSTYNNNQYRVLIEGTCTPSLNSETVRLIVDEQPEIIQEPVDQTICENDDALFVVNAGLTTEAVYSWEYSIDGIGWAAASDLGEITNDTNDSLIVSNVPSTYNAYMFRLDVGGKCPVPVPSAEVTMTVHERPQIDTHPQSEAACEQDSVFFFVETGVTTSPAYSWQIFNGSTWVTPSSGIYQGTDSDTLFINGISSSLNGAEYRVIVGGACPPSEISNTAVLTVYERPEILTHPVAVEICENENTSFVLDAGVTTTATYKWEYFDGAIWNTATGGVFTTEITKTLTLTNVPAGMDTYLFRGIVFGECDPSDTTLEVELRVRIRPNILTQPIDATTCESISVGFNVDAGLTYSPNYQWQYHDGTSGWLNTLGANYSGATTNALTINSPNSSMNGYAYRVILNGYCTPQLISDSITLTVEEDPEVTLQPLSAIICENTDTSFTINAGVTTLPVYAWYYDDGTSGWQLVTADGVHSGFITNTLVLTNVPFAYDNYRYYAEVTGKCGNFENSDQVSLSVYKRPEISVQPSDTAACELNNVAFSIETGDTDGPIIQWEVYDGSSWQAIIDGGNYTGSNSDLLKVFSIDSAMTGYLYHAVVSGVCESPVTSDAGELTVYNAPKIWSDPVDVMVCEGTTSEFEVVVTGDNLNYFWQVDMLDGFGYQDLSDDAVYNGSGTTKLTVTTPDRTFSSYRYRVRVEGDCNPLTISNIAILSINIGPKISVQPVSDTICESGSVSYSVNVQGAGLNYLWQEFDGGSWSDLSDVGDYIGTETPTMSIFNVQRGYNGYKYRAIITGNCPSPITSDEPELIVKTSPEITLQPQSLAICEDNSAVFTVASDGSDLEYQWQFSSGGAFADLANDGNYNGVETNTLTVTDNGALYDGYRFKVRVSGTCSPAVNSEEALLDVNANPQIVGVPANSEICEGGNTSFMSGATGFDLVYQWEVSTDNGGSWSTLAEGGDYENVNTSTLGIINAPVSLNDNLYRLSVSNACTAASSQTARLIVNANPTVNITGDGGFPLVCGGFDLNLDGNAAGGTGVYNDHEWKGDITYLSSTTDEQVVFNSLIKGNYDLVYTVTDSKGCIGVASATIENDRPNAQFTSDAVPTCGDLTVNFVNASTGAVGYEWFFDDGGPTETSVNAVHDFDNFEPSVRYYNIELVATSVNSCRDTAYQVVTVYPKVDAEFDLDPTEACQPVTAQMVALPGASKYSWDFGDGVQEEDGGYFAVHTYLNTTTSPKTYSILLTTESYYGCVAISTKDILVNPIPQPNFSVAPLLQTYPDATVSVTNLVVSPGTWAYLYDFGDGNTSTQAEPSHTYDGPGTYTVTQKVIFGDCVDSIRQSVIISPTPPVAGFNMPGSGCTPHLVQFENTSLYANSYIWDFGDGSISTKKDPVYTYFEQGTYAVTLKVAGPGGSNTFKANIEIWATPNLFFNNAPDSVYVNDKPVKFFNYSSDATNYEWNFGDYDEETNTESSTNISTEFEPSHIYEYVGSKDVLLLGWNEHCSDTVFKEAAVYVSPAGALQFPNVFKPNPNGSSGGYYDPDNPASVNTIFFPGVIDQVLEYDLYIYNRWGEMVFHSSEVNVGWDGYVKERLAKQGVYIWKVKGKYTNGKNFVEEGDVTLLH